MVEVCPERESFVLAEARLMVLEELRGWSKGKDSWRSLKGDRGWEVGAL